MQNLNVCITGGSGFIGRHLSRALLAQGCRVVDYDLKPPAAGYEEGVIYAEGDVRNRDRLKQVLREWDIQVLIHLAAVSTIQQGAENTQRTGTTNIGGTHAVMRAAAEYGKLHLLLHASTDKVYGRMRHGAYREEDPLEPLNSLYDQTKCGADLLVRQYTPVWQVPAVVLRFCNIYGPGDPNLTRIVPRSIHMLLAEHSPCILRRYEDAQGKLQDYYRDFLYVGDLCQAIVRIIQLRETLGDPQFAGFYGEAFNLGGSGCIPMDRVLSTIQRACGVTFPPIIEIQHSIPEIEVQNMDYAKAAKAFGFRPETSFEQGIRLTVNAWLEENRHE